MSIVSEEPLINSVNDKLNRSIFAQSLARNINKYEGNKSITIGLMGRWGIGKSSIINMVKEQIDINYIEIVEFNPWYFSGRKQLISDFFEVLGNRIGKSNDSLNKLSKDLKFYSKLLKPMTLIPQIAPLISVLTNLNDAGQTVLNEYLDYKNDDIYTMKEKINTGLNEYNKKILVIIDEIDRLENEEIKEVFQMVRALGDFNNVIYLMSFDKEKVIKVFKSGEDYLEKIINVPILIPEVNKDNINKYFIDNLNTIFKGISIDNTHWEKAYKFVFYNKFNDLREVNRFVNIIRFSKNEIIEELNVIDYLIISFIKMFEEDIYEFIKENKSVLINKINYSVLRKLIDKFKGRINRGLELNEILKLLFIENKNSLRSIRNEKYFNSYFEYALPENAYKVKQLNEIVSIKKKDNLYIYLEHKNKRELTYLYDNLNEISELLNDEQIYLFSEVLFEKISILDKGVQNSFIVESEQSKAFKNMGEMINRINKKDDKVVNIIDNIKISTDYELKPIIDYVYKLYNHFNSLEVKKKITMKLEEEIYRLGNKSEIIANFNKLKKMNFDVEAYIKKLLESREELIFYLNSLVRVVNIGYYEIKDENGEVVDVEEYEERAIVLEDITDYIDYNYIKKIINSYNIEESLQELINLFNNACPYSSVYREEIEAEESFYEDYI